MGPQRPAEVAASAVAEHRVAGHLALPHTFLETEQGLLTGRLTPMSRYSDTWRCTSSARASATTIDDAGLEQSEAEEEEAVAEDTSFRVTLHLDTSVSWPNTPCHVAVDPP